MIKKLQKTKQILVILVLSAIAFSSGFPAAQAALFNWPSSQDSSSSASQAFSFVTSYLSSSSQLSDDQVNEETLPIVQNNSIVSVSSANIAKKTIRPAKESTASQILKELLVSATAYSSTPDQTDDSPFITAMGTSVRDGIIATNFLPFGTKIKIPEIYGDKVFVVEDRMNRRYWYTIDIWFPDRASALEFGYKHVKIQILES